MSNQKPDSLPLPPGSTGLPLIGETLAFLQSPAKFAETRERQHGKVFITHLLGAKTVMMIGHTANHWIFSGEDKYLQNRWSYAIRQLLGADSLSQLNGEKHRERRQMFMPHFKYEAMSHFVPSIERLTRQHLERWAAQGGILTVETEMRQLAFEIIAIFIFGDDAAKLDLPLLSHHFQTWEAGMFAPVTINLPFTTFGKALKSKQVLMETIAPLVAERRKSGQQSYDVLGTLLTVRDNDGNLLSDQTIVHEIQLLLFAGHDTTVTSNTNILMMLAQHPDVLKTAREEQAALPEDARTFTLENLKKMPYLDAVIHESMRCVPPIGGMFRVTTQDVEFGGYRIPKGWVIALNPGRTHRDESIWGNPDQFDPSRWVNGEKRPAFSHIAFGGGPHLCLGQNFALVEMKLILAQLLRGYQWELTPDQDLTFRTFPFPLPKSGVKVRFSKL